MPVEIVFRSWRRGERGRRGPHLCVAEGCILLGEAGSDDGLGRASEVDQCFCRCLSDGPAQNLRRSPALAGRGTKSLGQMDPAALSRAERARSLRSGGRSKPAQHFFRGIGSSCGGAEHESP